MSWSITNVGTKEDVLAAIDEAVTRPYSMPATVGDYLKDAIKAVDLPPGFLVRVEAHGHRPGNSESTKVEVIKSGPWGVAK